MMTEDQTAVPGRIPSPTGSSKPLFQGRALTSVLISLSFIILAVSGLVLWASPPGRIANWTDWSMLGLRKGEWANLHIWFSLVFLVVAAFHILLNWRPLLNYFKDRISKRFGLRQEWVLATAICAVVFAGVQWQVPPFVTVLRWTEQFRASWEKPAERPPIPHAELLTLQELAEKAGVDLKPALARLEARGLKFVMPEIRMAELAKRNQLPARQIYDVMLQTGMPASSAQPADTVPHRPGGGPGQKTLAQFCADEGLDLATVQSRLAAKGLKASPDQTLRDIARQNGFQKPYELMEILRSK